ncbi:MAG TPA: DUF488 family protein [Verrucomicrobiae bacterium]|nr:DUF488 family protein [Verrucomicrobiae bacterium]
MTSRREKFDIRIKRVYEKSSPDDGARFLVDGLWPRGVKKEALSSVQWVKEIAPSASLRKWYSHDPDKWKEFQRRYRRELSGNIPALKPLVDAVKQGSVTLLTSTHDVEISHAMVLQDFLKRKVAA